MIRITFTEEQVAQLRYERFHHPHPRVQAKMEALLLKSEGLPHKETCRLVGITPIRCVPTCGSFSPGASMR